MKVLFNLFFLLFLSSCSVPQTENSDNGGWSTSPTLGKTGNYCKEFVVVNDNSDKPVSVPESMP